jgi:hypothetical protein
VGHGHWILLIPYYFFAALALLLAAVLTARVLRLRVSVNPLALGAVLAAIAIVALPPLLGWTGLGAYTVPRMLLLAAASLVIAFLDALLAPRLPLDLDRELADL